MSYIFHITTKQEWEDSKQKGSYSAASLAIEGFIHCSHQEQLKGVMERYFAGKTGLIKLVIDTDKLSSKFIHEWSPSTQDTFPHIYGPINFDAVVEVITIN